MRDLELALKAAGDPTRTRILKLLEGRGLCVCQVQAVLALAPSTVSKHLAILKLAGLVEDRRDGKWIEYALASEPTRYAKAVLTLMGGPLNRDAAIAADRRRLREVLRVSRERLCSLPPTRRAPRTGPQRPRRKDSPHA
jgi:ArsR family transcriptional regulator, arsenate/arsenite/antimonite-responsive transcriptional repressor